MTNCPRCSKPILNGGIFTSHAKFTIRCPWCQATLEINIQPRIVTEVIKIGNGDPAAMAARGEAVDRPAQIPHFEAQHNATGKPEELFAKPKGAGFRLVGYLYPEQRE